MKRTSSGWIRGALLFAAIILNGCATPSPSTVARTQNVDAFGVLVMAHGGSKQWNERVLASVEPLRGKYKVDVAFGMADAASLQRSVTNLEAQGVRHIGVVRLFVSGESWYQRTQQILGIVPGAPARSAQDAHAGHEHQENAGHSMEFWRLDSHSTFVLSTEGLADAREMDAILAERAAQLSKHPESEDVLILAHGPGDDTENTRWIEKITARTESIRDTRPFRRIEVRTLREDWPEKRAAAEQDAREFVQRAQRENGRVIVIPFRVEGFGPYAKVFEGLDYTADGVGLLPHPNVTKWIERQIIELRERS